jgi:hypothetical protein
MDHIEPAEPPVSEEYTQTETISRESSIAAEWISENLNRLGI